MWISFDLKVITISLVVLTSLDNFTVFGQQTRGTNCGTKFNANKVKDFVVSSSSEIKIHEVIHACKSPKTFLCCLRF